MTLEKRKLRNNVIFSVVHQIAAVIFGLLIPRLILKTYGSEINGYVYSITQMLSVITFFDFGVSSVAQAALYKPLVKRNYSEISLIYSATKKYFRFLGQILVIYVAALCFYYGFSRSDKYSFFFSVALVLSISVSMIGQYLFGLTDQVLLAADQRIYIYSIVDTVIICANGLATCWAIKCEYGIQVVKLITSIVFLIRPIILHFYVIKKYHITSDDGENEYRLPQQWSGLVQHLASTLILSLDTIILTFASTLQNISIYNVYTFPLNGIRGMVTAVGGSYKSFFGQVIVSEEHETLNVEFTKFEMLFHFLGNMVLCVSAMLIVPFVKIYTAGISDTNYINYLFAYLIVLSYSILIIRIPYTTVIISAGHFKETQMYCVIEFFVNVIISILLTQRYGLVGVTIGTLLAVGYRMLASVIYLKKHILNRCVRIFGKRIIEDVVVVGVFALIMNKLFRGIIVKSYYIWFEYALLFTLVFSGVSIIVYSVSEKEILFSLLQSIKTKMFGRHIT
ncbi:lipopolysaccharide biosynthesis protein [Butyrivibrio sp. XBB1001]|uniref:lipopolysaccharide biosynthesis protein n=1 Tax=Butyrivibrio sp. XBB1001 TaxID=1280682 RepID=UPI00041123D3|nr:polysaccharide biosynthesis C-terminal domain-containing protein [Butyrivibrio sp. XBB1001]